MLPVRPERHIALEQFGLLARPIEDQHVVAAPQRRSHTGDPHAGPRTITAVHPDHRRALGRGVVRPEEPAGQRGLLVGDGDLRDLGRGVRDEPAPRLLLFGERRCQLTGVGERTLRVDCHGVVRGRPQICSGRTDRMPGCGGLLGGGQRSLGEPVPGRVPSLVIPLADSGDRGEDLAGLGCPLDAEAQGGADFVVVIRIGGEPGNRVLAHLCACLSGHG